MIRLSNKYTIRRQTLLLNSLAPHSLPADPPAAASLCLSYLIPSDPPTRGRLRCRPVLGVVWPPLPLWRRPEMRVRWPCFIGWLSFMISRRGRLVVACLLSLRLICRLWTNLFSASPTPVLC
jgi:hypothetical protein